MKKRKQGDKSVPNPTDPVDKPEPPTLKILLAMIAAVVPIIVAIIGFWGNRQNAIWSIETTQTAQALPSITMEPDPQYVALEAMRVDVVSYSGQTDANLGDSTAFLSIVRGDSDVIQYWLDYEIFLPDNPGTAGLEFKFPNLQSLAAYKYVDFTIDFVSPDMQVGFYFENEGENGGGDAVTLSRDMHIEDVSVTHLGNEKYRFRIPLERFTDTNMSNVREFGIYVNNDLFVGKGKIMIEDILFEVR